MYGQADRMWSTIRCGGHVVQSSKRLEKERTRLLCLAKMPFDDGNLMHLRLLQSVYLSFVGGPGSVGRSVIQHRALVQMCQKSHAARDVCFCHVLFVHCKGTWTNWRACGMSLRNGFPPILLLFWAY